MMDLNFIVKTKMNSNINQLHKISVGQLELEIYNKKFIDL